LRHPALAPLLSRFVSCSLFFLPTPPPPRPTLFPYTTLFRSSLDLQAFIPSSQHIIQMKIKLVKIDLQSISFAQKRHFRVLAFRRYTHIHSLPTRMYISFKIPFGLFVIQEYIDIVISPVNPPLRND